MATVLACQQPPPPVSDEALVRSIEALRAGNALCNRDEELLRRVLLEVATEPYGDGESVRAAMGPLDLRVADLCVHPDLLGVLGDLAVESMNDGEDAVAAKVTQITDYPRAATILMSNAVTSESIEQLRNRLRERQGTLVLGLCR